MPAVKNAGNRRNRMYLYGDKIKGHFSVRGKYQKNGGMGPNEWPEGGKDGICKRNVFTI